MTGDQFWDEAIALRAGVYEGVTFDRPVCPEPGAAVVFKDCTFAARKDEG